MKTRAIFSLLLTLVFVFPAVAQTAAIHDGWPALKFRHQEGKHAGAYFVEYVEYANEPAFRIRAHHYHGWCNGYLYLTPKLVAYDPSLTPQQQDGLAISRSDVASFHPRFSGYEFSAPGKLYKIAFLSDPDRRLSPGERDERSDLMKFVALAYSDFAAAQRQFFAMLAGAQVGATPKSGAPAMPTFQATPMIRILDPEVAAANSIVDGSAPMQPIIGVASASAGIVAVVVNGDPAKVKPLSKEVALFQTGRFTLLDGNNNDFKVDATAADGGNGSVTFRVAKPSVNIVAPPAGSRTHNDKVTIQGTVTGMRDLKQLEIAGKPVAFTQRGDGGIDFRTADLPLAIGPNVITGFTTTEDDRRSTFSLLVRRIPPVPALTLLGIERALKNSVSPVRIEALVDDQGVDFELTPELEKRLRSDGAPQRLLDAIADAYTTPAR